MAYQIKQQFLRYGNPGEPFINLKGIVIHGTDNVGGTAQNHYDYWQRADRQASVHWMSDWIGNDILQFIPENSIAWHVGSWQGNREWLGTEMCETNNKEQFDIVWKKTVWLVATVCVKHGWNTKDNVWSHNGMKTLYSGITHSDPHGYLQRMGRNWDQLLADIDAKITELKNPVQTEPIQSQQQEQSAPVEPTSTPAPKPVQNFTYPNNARCVNDSLYIRDENGVRIEGREVFIGDNVTVIRVNPNTNLVYLEYPTPSGVKSGWVKNTCLQYFNVDKYHNGSTKEIVFSEDGRTIIGSLDPYEKATILYKKNGMICVVYNTVKGVRSKSGLVKFRGL